MGDSLSSEITTAWEAAQSAAEKYGDYVTALMTGIQADIDSITAQIESLEEQIANKSYSSGGGGSLGLTGKNTTVADKGENDKQNNKDMVTTIVRNMKDLSSAWSNRNDPNANVKMHDQAARYASQLDQYGVHAEFNSKDGTWRITRDELDPSHVGKLLYNCYHTGGFVGTKPLKTNETLIKAENGELMMTATQQGTLAEQIERIDALTSMLEKIVAPSASFAIGSDLNTNGSPLSNVVNNNSSPNITIGDVIIQGNASSATVEAHREITRKFANEIFSYLNK